MPPTPDQDSEQAALWPLNSSPARFTCAYHHCIVLRLQASPGVRESSSPCAVGRGTHGPAEPSAICGHFCLGLLGWEFACKQPFVPLQAGGGAGRRRKRRSCSPAAVFGPGPRLNGDTELPAAWPVYPGQSPGRSPVDLAEVPRLQTSRAITVLLLLQGSAVPGAVPTRRATPHVGPRRGALRLRRVCACARVCTCVFQRAVPSPALSCFSLRNSMSRMSWGWESK